MNELWQVLLLSLLPGAGNFAGGLIAECWKPSPRLLNWALHAASGTSLVRAVVSVVKYFAWDSGEPRRRVRIA